MNDIDKHLADAMGEPTGSTNEQQAAAPEPATSTSKRTLKGAMVADKPASVPVERKSEEEIRLEIKLELMKELLAEANTAKKKVRADVAAAKDEEEPEELVRFGVNLPPQSSCIRLDGREYYHGHAYDVRRRQALSMQDIQARAWEHDEQVQGRRQHAPGVATGGIQINGSGQAITSPAGAAAF